MIAALKRRAALVAVVASVMSLGLAAVAVASTVQYLTNTSNSSYLGPYHPLTNSTVGSIYGGEVCAWAYDASISPYGTPACTSGAGNTATESLPGLYLYGWCGVPQGYPAATMNCRETWYP